MSWIINAGNGVTDGIGCPNLPNGRDFKAPGHLGEEGGVRPSDDEEKGARAHGRKLRPVESENSTHRSPFLPRGRGRVSREFLLREPSP